MAAASLVKTDKTAQAANEWSKTENAYGCLVDTTLCVGCRKCEQACNQKQSGNYTHYDSFFAFLRIDIIRIFSSRLLNFWTFVIRIFQDIFSAINAK